MQKTKSFVRFPFHILLFNNLTAKIFCDSYNFLFTIVKIMVMAWRWPKLNSLHSYHPFCVHFTLILPGFTFHVTRSAHYSRLTLKWVSNQEHNLMMRANVCGGPSVGTQSVGFECFRGRCTFVQLLREIVMVRSRQALLVGI